MIVAGPGAGKTTVLVLRALRLVFVDGALPEHIVVTTFTRKAADELRSRLIDWSLQFIEYLRSPEAPPRGADFLDWLDGVDINRFVTGTLDSLCEDALGRYRDVTDAPIVVVDGVVANSAFVRDGILAGNAQDDDALGQYLAPYTIFDSAPSSVYDLVRVAKPFVDRFVHDRVDLSGYKESEVPAAGRYALAGVADRYWTALLDKRRVDFSLLEQAFLDRLEADRLTRFTSGIRAVLVDEYQDTNPLQERIYFEIVRRANASFTIVGDDDQSLYRFRGATIELFRDFIDRFHAAIPSSPRPTQIDLVDNYRSTPEIVDFFNGFLANDLAFGAARVQPPKPPIRATMPTLNVGVLGFFRDSVQDLATDLASFLYAIFRGEGYVVPQTGTRITRAPTGGDFGDAVMLAHSVNEYAGSFGPTPPKARLPRLMRDELNALGVASFNPRGRALRDIPVVQQLLGCLLCCIDYDGSVQQSLKLRNEAIRYLDRWRVEGRQFIASAPAPSTPHSLADFVEAWRRRTPQGPTRWPDEWPLLELCFKLLSWFPTLRDDPEGQVYLEAVTRAIAQASSFSPYRSMIVHGRDHHDLGSTKAALRDILSPIAEGGVDVDEDILPSVPRDRFCFMTIHQSKGLEFPLVIVDVGSDFRTNHHTQRPRRFPAMPGSAQMAEDELAPYASVGPLRLARSSLSRTFDDLIRLNYVAFSRPESVLVVVGLRSALAHASPIQNVATWWRQNGQWAWRGVGPDPATGLASGIPLHLI